MKRIFAFAFGSFIACGLVVSLSSVVVSVAHAEQIAIQVVDATGKNLTGDPVNGAKVFKQCQTCHFIQPAKNFTGPTLYGIIGRKAGTVEKFSYSKANRESGKVWTEQAMFDYLENPRKTIPGTKMSFVGLKKPQDRADVISFIQLNSGPQAAAAPAK
jgi:cytochrome c